ncbi:hypothetical protein [Nannocystis pusilla]|uniref:hypothetical protein n=1 Tax=Nannocystis pusilla TaxID=889268 RepID=UPI003B7A77AC
MRKGEPQASPSCLPRVTRSAALVLTNFNTRMLASERSVPRNSGVRICWRLSSS